MIRPKLSLRRLLATAGAATLGLAASLAIAAPASATAKSSAYQPKVSGEAYCDTETGNWIVNWEVTNSEKDFAGKITAVAVEPKGNLTKIVRGATLPKKGNGSLTDEQVVSNDKKKASLTVTVKWDRGKKQSVKTATRTATVKFDGTCKKSVAKPEAAFADSCEGVTVTLSNHRKATKDAEFIVTGEDGFEETVVVAKGKSKDVFVPAENAGNIEVTEGGEKIRDHSWTKPEDCTGPSDPQIHSESTCDNLIIHINNPEDGAEFSTVVTPNQGEPQEVTVEPGQTKSVEFPASEGLLVTIDGVSEFAWEKPADCDTPGETPGDTPGDGGDGGGLPVTGAQAGAIAGGAAVLLAVGVGLFLMARRRRITFTA
ncbi:MAG TPA: cell wall anchor protein [Micromonospora sp.]|nr:cell wall anchor protein [Micromonospora sp.]